MTQAHLEDVFTKKLALWSVDDIKRRTPKAQINPLRSRDVRQKAEWVVNRRQLR